MTFGQLLFWILIAIIAYFLINVSMVILIIVIIVLVIYFLIGNIESSQVKPYQMYNYNEYFEELDIPDQNFEDSQMESSKWYVPDKNCEDLQMEPPNWYVPVKEYYDEKMNSRHILNSYDAPQSISEYCVNKHMQQSNDLPTSILNCDVPIKMNAI